MSASDHLNERQHGGHRPTPRLVRAAQRLSAQRFPNQPEGLSATDAQDIINIYRDSRDNNVTGGFTPKWAMEKTMKNVVNEARDSNWDNIAEDRYQRNYGDAGNSPRDSRGEDDGKRAYLFDHPEKD
jgi:hypothetical protein